MKIQNQSNKELDTQIKTKIANVWELGDYQNVSTMLPPISSRLVKLLKIQPGESVLDVACGNGNSAITARRYGANVTGIDITSELLDLTKEEERIAALLFGFALVLMILTSDAVLAKPNFGGCMYV